MDIQTAVILAGGEGKRLLPLTSDKPKALVPVLKRPLIEWIILWLKNNGVKEVVVSVDYKKEALMEHLGDGRRLGVKLRYNDHGGAKDTGDAFRSVFQNKNLKLPDTFFAMNGDQITDLPLAELASLHRAAKPLATLTACPVRLPYGIIELDGDQTARKFQEKPILTDTLMNAGIYVFRKNILKYLTRRGAIEKTAFPQLARAGLLKVYTHRGLFTTVNTVKDLAESEKILKNYKNLV